MSHLIFCSFEVGGLPFRMAEILNRHGVKTYYVSLAKEPSGHDSTQFHYGGKNVDWDLSYMFNNTLLSCQGVITSFLPFKIVRILGQIKRKYGISSCLATGDMAYMLRKAGINYKYWSYGSDLDQQCFSLILPNNYPLWKSYAAYCYFVFKGRPKARRSICQADSVMIAPYQIDALQQICSNKALFFLPHFLKVLDYKELLQKRADNKKVICEKIQAKQFFFSSTRHFWTGENNEMSDNKGNNIALISFANYLKIAEDYNAKLVLVNKGPDVELSKSFANSLGIDKHIVWINEMGRNELDKYYQGATICLGQFGTPVITFSVLEPLSNASVCVSFFENCDERIPYYKEIPPVINTQCPDEIANHIYRLTIDADYYNDLSYRSWRWIRDNCSEEKFVESFLKLFK